MNSQQTSKINNTNQPIKQRIPKLDLTKGVQTFFKRQNINFSRNLSDYSTPDKKHSYKEQIEQDKFQNNQYTTQEEAESFNYQVKNEFEMLQRTDQGGDNQEQLKYSIQHQRATCQRAIQQIQIQSCIAQLELLSSINQNESNDFSSTKELILEELQDFQNPKSVEIYNSIVDKCIKAIKQASQNQEKERLEDAKSLLKQTLQIREQVLRQQYESKYQNEIEKLQQGLEFQLRNEISAVEEDYKTKFALIVQDITEKVNQKFAYGSQQYLDLQKNYQNQYLASFVSQYEQRKKEQIEELEAEITAKTEAAMQEVQQMTQPLLQQHIKQIDQEAQTDLQQKIESLRQEVSQEIQSKLEEQEAISFREEQESKIRQQLQEEMLPEISLKILEQVNQEYEQKNKQVQQSVLEQLKFSLEEKLRAKKKELEKVYDSQVTQSIKEKQIVKEGEIQKRILINNKKKIQKYKEQVFQTIKEQLVLKLQPEYTNFEQQKTQVAQMKSKANVQFKNQMENINKKQKYCEELQMMLNQKLQQMNRNLKFKQLQETLLSEQKYLREYSKAMTPSRNSSRIKSALSADNSLISYRSQKKRSRKKNLIYQSLISQKWKSQCQQLNPAKSDEYVQLFNSQEREIVEQENQIGSESFKLTKEENSKMYQSLDANFLNNNEKINSNLKNESLVSQSLAQNQFYQYKKEELISSLRKEWPNFTSQSPPQRYQKVVKIEKKLDININDFKEQIFKDIQDNPPKQYYKGEEKKDIIGSISKKVKPKERITYKQLLEKLYKQHIQL